jgi:hypothetical protein
VALSRSRDRAFAADASRESVKRGALPKGAAMLN